MSTDGIHVFRTGFCSFTPAGHPSIRVRIEHSAGEVGRDHPAAVECRDVAEALFYTDEWTTAQVAKFSGLVETVRKEHAEIAALVDKTVRERDEAQAGVQRLLTRVPARIFGTGTVRFDGRGGIWVLNTREQGWASTGFRFESWDELFRKFNVRVTTHGTDEHGAYWNIENAGGEP